MENLGHQPSAKQQSKSVPYVERIVEKNSIRTKEDLRRVVQELLADVGMPEAAIAVPRGAIDRTIFPLHELNVVDPFEGSAKFHDHRTYEVALVPQDGAVLVPTLISSQDAVVAALRENLHPQAVEAWKHANGGGAVRRIDQVLRAEPNVNHAYEAYQRIVRESIGEPLYPLLEAIQRSVRDLVEVRWADYDICVLGKKCVHARDIRSRRVRECKDQLRYMIPRRYEEKPLDAVPSAQ